MQQPELFLFVHGFLLCEASRHEADNMNVVITSRLDQKLLFHFKLVWSNQKRYKLLL